MSPADLWHRVVSLAAAEPLLGRLLLASIELAALAAFVWLLLRLSRVRSARLASLLWLLVLAKPVVSLLVGSPLPIVMFHGAARPNAQPDTAALASNESAERQHARAHATAQHGLSPEVGAAWLPSDVADALAPSVQPPSSAVPADTATTGRSNWSKPRTALSLWLCGVVLFASRSVIDRLRLRRIVAAARPAGAALRLRFDKLAGCQGQAKLARAARRATALRPPPRLLVTDRLESPALVGTFTPLVLVPEWLARDTVTGKLDWALRHELAHHKHRDPLAAAVRELAQILFYFHPAAWWSGRKWHEAAELACDRALVHNDADAHNYAEQLYQILLHTRAHRRPALTPGLFATRTQIGRRIEALLSGPLTSPAKPSAFAMACLGIATIATFACGAGLQRVPGGRSKSAAQRTTRPDARQASGRTRQTETAPLPRGVLRVYGESRMRTWGAYAVALHPDGQTLAVAGQNHVMLIDWKKGKTERVLATNHGFGEGLAFSPDGGRLAIGTYAGQIEIWDLEKEHRIQLIAADPIGVTSVLFLDDGITLISGGCDGMIKFWNADTGELQRQWQAHDRSDQPGMRLAIDKMQSRLVSGQRDGQVRLWDLSNGALLRTHRAHTEHPQTFVADVAISPDGKYIASSGFLDGTVKVWNTADGAVVHDFAKIEIEAYPRVKVTGTLEFSPDGKLLAIARMWNYATEIEIVDVETGRQLSRRTAHTNEMWWYDNLAFSQDGNFVISTTRDNFICVWDRARADELHPTTDHRSPLSDVAFSPDGSTLATSAHSEQRVCLWNVDSGERIDQIDLSQEVQPSNVKDWKLSFSPDGEYLAVARANRTRLWKVATRQPAASFPGFSWQVSFSPDGKWLTTTSVENGTTVWDIHKQAPIFNTDQGVGSLDLAAVTEGSKLFVGGGRGGTKAFDLDTEEELFHLPQVRAIAVSRDGNTLAARNDAQIDLYDGTTGNPTGSLVHQGYVGSAQFSPDGRFIATASGGLVQLWDVASRSSVHAWHIGYQDVTSLYCVHQLAFSPDGRYLATANANGTAYLLDVQRP